MNTFTLKVDQPAFVDETSFSITVFSKITFSLGQTNCDTSSKFVSDIPS